MAPTASPLVGMPRGLLLPVGLSRRVRPLTRGYPLPLPTLGQDGGMMQIIKSFVDHAKEGITLVSSDPDLHNGMKQGLMCTESEY